MKSRVCGFVVVAVLIVGYMLGCGGERGRKETLPEVSTIRVAPNEAGFYWDVIGGWKLVPRDVGVTGVDGRVIVAVSCDPVDDSEAGVCKMTAAEGVQLVRAKAFECFDDLLVAQDGQFWSASYPEYRGGAVGLPYWLYQTGDPDSKEPIMGAYCWPADGWRKFDWTTDEEEERKDE